MENSYILLTGATSGIGKVMAQNLSKSNKLILCGRNPDKLDFTAKECENASEHIKWLIDLSKFEDIADSLSNLLKENNIKIRAFVHCAGFMKLMPLRVQTNDLIKETFSTNIFSASVITQVLVKKKFNDNNLKSIVFISSNISNMGAKAMSVYGASKGALDSLMRCLAIELAPAVRVNSVLPGAIITKMSDDIEKEVIDRMESTYPLGLGNPNDIYNAVEFLLSEENARWITGQQIVVDGGRTINVTG